MNLGIDASNIRAGGGVTHLVELLGAENLCLHGFNKVIVWGSSATLAKIKDNDWLDKKPVLLLDRCLPFRLYWQYFRLKNLVEYSNCKLLFVPGGSDLSGFKPMVTISQNLIPFEWREMRRFGWSLLTLKFLFLRMSQSHSFRKAKGVIFLTTYARNIVLKVCGALRGKNMIIPHGVNNRFFREPRAQRLTNEFNQNQPCRVIYVSIVDPYKHQWQVALAVSKLRSMGIHIVLELIGPPARGMKRLKKVINDVDPEGIFIKYRGGIAYEKLDTFYETADIGVFASSCENLPNILIEGMAAGLPMACSSMGPMPEVLGNAGVYFDPENVDDIAGALLKLINSSDLRTALAHAAFVQAKQYSWKKCADETFRFLAEIVHN